MSDTPFRDAVFTDLDSEFAATRRVLARVPWDQAAWKPHERSMSLGSLATHIATLPRFAAAVLATDGQDMMAYRVPGPEIGSTDSLLGAWDESAAALNDALADADDDALATEWPMTAGGQTLSADPRHASIRRWGLSHIAHHRGQLTVYLRLLDVPVPGVYGPSADDRAGR